MSTREKIKSELLEMANEREKILEASTDRKLERITLRERELQWALSDVGRQESSVRSTSKPSGKERDLLAAIRENMTQERVIFTDIHGALPRQFILADATSHFRAPIAAKKTELDKMMSPFATSQNAKPGPRILELEQATERLEVEWTQQTKKLCHAGERVFALRQERQRLQSESNNLREVREAKAVAAAGI